MLAQFIIIHNPFAGRIGIREIGLIAVVAGTDGQRSDRGQSGAEEIAGIVIGRHLLFFAPAFHPVAFSIGILKFGQAESLVEGKISGEGYFPHIAPPLLCRNQDHAVRRLAAIQSCRGRTFQDTDAFHILRIQVRDAIASVPVTGIRRAANSGKSLFVGSV